MNKNIIFTDGSSRGNPGSGGWGAIVVLDGKVKEIGGYESNTTNNRMEMNAVIEALKFSLSSVGAESNSLLIYCDSSYVINGATKWAKGWQANGWKTKAKEEVLNRDLWESLIALVDQFKIKWIQIEGHAGIPANERCDVIATSYADKENISLYEGPLENYEIDILDVSPKTNIKKSKSNSTKAYSYISKVDGKIEIHKTWAECEKRVKGESGARFKKSISKEDEEKIVSDFSN